MGQAQATKPDFYTVTIHRDGITPRSLLTGLLTEVFNIDPHKAEEQMNDLLANGHIHCGRFTEDVAKSKAKYIRGFGQTIYAIPVDIDRVP